MIYNKKWFAELVTDAVMAVARKPGVKKSIGAAEQMIAEAIPCAQTTIQKYRNPKIKTMPTDPAGFAERLIQFCSQQGVLTQPWADSLLTQTHHPSRKGVLEKFFNRAENRIFLSYKGNSPLDERLAKQVHQFLVTQGQRVFPDSNLHTDAAWFDEVERQIETSDLLVILLSHELVHNEMVHALVRRAGEYRRLQGRPEIVPVLIAYQGPLPYPVNVFLDAQKYIIWNEEGDNDRVVQEVLAASKGELAPKTPLPAQSIAPGFVSPPEPAFDPRILQALDAPGGALRLNDPFYIERAADVQFKEQIARLGTTTTISAERQTGKTSLLVRGMHHARQMGSPVVDIDMQIVGEEYLVSIHDFLHYLADFIVSSLGLDLEEVARAWQHSRGPKDKLTILMEDYILTSVQAPIVMAIDEADALLKTDFYQEFFSLMRAWHNKRARDERWDNLNIVLVISTEPYLLIPDVHQSPFNVGPRISLTDFDETQVAILNQRHGSPLSRAQIAELMNLLNGHPYLTRKAFYSLVNDQLTWPELVNIAATDKGPFSDHLQRYYWLIHQKQDLKKGLIQVIEQHRCDDETVYFRLFRAGLLKQKRKDFCEFRCELYKVYLENKL